MNIADLKKPFAPDRISWRLGSTNQEKTKRPSFPAVALDEEHRRDSMLQDLYFAFAFIPECEDHKAGFLPALLNIYSCAACLSVACFDKSS